jgi:hypothetical protein
MRRAGLRGLLMLYAFGFDRLGVLVSDLYFVDPAPGKGQEGPEHGVRLELRLLERGDLKGSAYSARPITAGEPVWRADLLESVAGPPGSFDRTHHHPRFSGWNPGRRVFEPGLTGDPVGWLGGKLSGLPALLAEAGLPADTASPADLAGLRDAVPEILDVTRRLLARVRAGELGRAPDGEPGGSVRASWL